VWGIGTAGLVLVGQVIVVFVLLSSRYGTLVKIDHSKFDESLAYNGVLLTWATILSAIMTCGIVALVVKLRRGSDLREYLGLKGATVRTILKWTGVVVLFEIAGELTQLAFGHPISPEFMFTAYRTADPVWALWLAVVVASPLAEETFFRGFLLKGWAASFL